MQLFGPLQMRGLIMFLPQFVRVFWRLMNDARVSMLAKLVPFLGMLAADLATRRSNLTSFRSSANSIGCWSVTSALKIFIWLCPPDVVRDHVSDVARGA